MGKEMTEGYVSIWMYQQAKNGFGWSNMSVKVPHSLDYVKSNPELIQSAAVPENPPVWTPTKTELGRKHMIIGAKRPFDHKLNNRQLKLNTKLKWVFGFFDMTGIGAYSDTMETALDDGNPNPAPAPAPTPVVT